MVKPIEIPCYPEGKVDNFTSAVNLKKFLGELHDVLVHEGFKDVVNANGHVKKGEWVDSGETNRTGDMYETKYSWSNFGDFVDFEIAWSAKVSTPHSEHGTLYFSLDLVCRTLKNVEVLEGNSKKTLQQGKWEFRNKFKYVNTVPLELEKSWIYQKFPALKNIYLKHMYDKILHSDELYCQEKLVPKIYKVIHKHFR